MQMFLSVLFDSVKQSGKSRALGAIPAMQSSCSWSSMESHALVSWLTAPTTLLQYSCCSVSSSQRVRDSDSRAAGTTVMVFLSSSSSVGICIRRLMRIMIPMRR